jgi:hypothetical protein
LRERRRTFKVLVGKPVVKRPLSKYRRRIDEKIKIDL